MIKHLLQTDLVGLETLGRVNNCLSELQQYIAGVPSVLKLSICTIGSYSTGLASRSGSMVDLVVRMDGGALTAALDGDQLALALAAGLKDWAFLTSLTPLGNNSATLICETIDRSIVLRVRACNTERFPVNHLYHSKLFGSYARCDPRFVILIIATKNWARTSGFSAQVPSSDCPLSGFHWTILVLFFLTNSGYVPNLHNPPSWLRDLPTVQYGPRQSEHSFASVANAEIGKRVCGLVELKELTIPTLVSRFFEWLAKTDLLSTSINMQVAGSDKKPLPPRKGWISILDPTMPWAENTIDHSFTQKSQVVFAMKLQREATLMAGLTKKASEIDLPGILCPKRVSMALSPNSENSVRKIDVSVPY